MARRLLLSVGSGPEPTAAPVRAGRGGLCRHESGRLDRLDREQLLVLVHHAQPRARAAPPELAHADATLIAQIETDDVAALLQRVLAAGGAAQGPERDSGAGFSFGSFRDPEGNSWWVVDADCP